MFDAISCHFNDLGFIGNRNKTKCIDSINVSSWASLYKVKVFLKDYKRPRVLNNYSLRTIGLPSIFNDNATFSYTS